jgi:hypothetical protein
MLFCFWLKNGRNCCVFIVLPMQNWFFFLWLLCMFGCAMKKNDFSRIDFVNLILVIIDLKIKWFIFWYIHAKVN